MLAASRGSSGAFIQLPFRSLDEISLASAYASLARVRRRVKHFFRLGACGLDGMTWLSLLSYGLR
jgi:hypothetical protein